MSFAFDASRYRNNHNTPWTAAMDTALRVKRRIDRKTGLQTAVEISAEFGVAITERCVFNRARRLNLPEITSVWNDEIVAAMIAMHTAGKSASVIAGELNAQFHTNFTRNSIIGKQHRLGLQKRKSSVLARVPGAPRAPRLPREPGAPRTVRVVKRIITEQDKRRAKFGRALGFKRSFGLVELEYTTPDSDLDIPSSQRKTFMELGRRDCRWGVGDVGHTDFFFCGGEVLDGHSYCAGHCARAFGYSR